MQNSIPSMVLSNPGPAGKTRTKTLDDYESCNANGMAGQGQAQIGTGSFSEVKLVRDKQTKAVYALKIVPIVSHNCYRLTRK